MENKMNMVVKSVAGDDIYGEASAVEIHFTQADGSDLYVMCDSAAGNYILSVSRTTQLPVFGDTSDGVKDDNKQLIERHEFMLGEEDTYGDVMQSAYYKAFDLAAHIQRDADWTTFDKSIAELSTPYIDKNIDDIEVIGTLDELLNGEDDE